MSEDLYAAGAEHAAEVLRSHGYAVTVKHYDPLPPSTLPPGFKYGFGRHYVLVDHEGHRYSAQWHERMPNGTGFMNSRGEHWNEATAKRLNTLVGAPLDWRQ